MITIIDYGAGNLRSVQNMLRHVGAEATIASTSAEIEKASKLILPGVGHFDFGMKNLASCGLLDVLHDKALNQQTPFLGICLGAQLLTRRSEEGDLPGLGWIAADTRRFDTSRLDDSLRVPHMGWAETEYQSENPFVQETGEKPRYYYVHSYHIVCDRQEDELCHATHGYRFTAGVQRDNIAGVQFHPEKSHRFGSAFLKKFVDLPC
ncbi:MAG: imidazole glycerol phosphate synthase subunit HisH [Fuerstiella sp.]|nr:imidazole glycerol phosphate synthase subunit HisH [Fuerstiella sp.]